MGKIIPTREQAFELLTTYNKSDSLIKHALVVEAVMLHFADILGEPEKEKQCIIGLVHDIDYEIIEKGAALLGMERDYIIEETIRGMQKAAESIGLKGDI